MIVTRPHSSRLNVQLAVDVQNSVATCCAETGGGRNGQVTADHASSSKELRARDPRSPDSLPHEGQKQ